MPSGWEHIHDKVTQRYFSQCEKQSRLQKQHKPCVRVELCRLCARPTLNLVLTHGIEHYFQHKAVFMNSILVKN